jgi:hypothetical protein
VDSGASRSFLPKTVASLLGIKSHELVRDAAGAKGVEGTGFATWSSTKQIVAQVIQVDPVNEQRTPWGPLIPMNPAFANKDVVLLGRDDFFPAFSITLSHQSARPSLVLRY